MIFFGSTYRSKSALVELAGAERSVSERSVICVSIYHYVTRAR